MSFLFQVYLYVDPERADKPWKKVVVRFLLWPVLLVSVLMLVLILSFEIWFPELLKSLRAFIPDIYKQIIAIITLLVSVSLFSLLLQRYMNKEPEKVAKIWKIIAYPVHFVIRLVARAVVLLAILLTVIMTPTFYPMYFAYRFDFFRFSAWLLLLLTILTTILISSLILISICIGIWNLELLESLWAFISNHWNNLNPKKEDLNIIMIIALLSGIGLFSFLLPKFIQDIKKSLSYIKEKIVEVLRDKWWPKIDIKESLKVTWHCYFARICPSIRETFAQSQKLFFALLLLCIISVCGYISVKELNKWQQDVEDSLVDIRTVTDTIKTDTAHLILLRSSGLSPAYLSKKENQISFSLIYPPQGNLISKKGICPEGDNLIWLQLFKQAILKCSEDSLMELQIQGFASAAPVLLNGYTTKSDSLNCEIANQRAKALIYFLALDDTKSYTLEKCKTVLNDGLIWKSVKSDSRWDRQGFTVTYKPWESHQITEAKQVEDGSLDNRRLDLEFLNRSVQIIVKGGDCWTKSVNDAGQSVEKPEVQSKSSEQ